MGKKEIQSDRLRQLEDLESSGVNPYPPHIPERSHHNAEVSTLIDQLQGDESTIHVVGRIMGVRHHGQRIFIDLEDESGRIQAMISKGVLADSVFDMIRTQIGLGDFIALGGSAMRTRSGEPTVHADSFELLSKALLPPPNMKDGVKDPEIARRQRYLEMMSDPDARERFRIRSLLVRDMRRFFEDELKCWEVETPVLDTVYGGASARPFVTHYNALNQAVYMRVSNELYLKRLLVGGFEGVFEFSKDFRNEGMDRTHNPEFTQVELYLAYTDYNWMMSMMEELMSSIAQERLGTTQITYQGQEIDLAAPWQRLSVYDGLKQFAGIDPDNMTDEEILSFALKQGIDEADAGYAILELFDRFVQPHLINPTFVIDYPASTSPLTKPHRTKPGLVERFECIVGGMEVANCYTELNDPRIQRRNFEDQRKRAEAGDEEAMPMDEDFIEAMEYGMPPMGGIGISIDRFTMLLTDSPHIRDVILFPISRTK